MNLGNLYFDMVSPVPESRSLPQQVLGRGQGDFVLRISYFASLRILMPIIPKNEDVRKITYEIISKNMQNKANFRKSQMNVSDYITIDYGKMDTWSSGKNKANSKPIQSQYKPNSNPIQSQYKPKQTQFFPATPFDRDCPPSVWWDKDKKMMLRLTINGLRKTVLIFYVKQSLVVQISKDIWEIGALKAIERKERQW